MASLLPHRAYAALLGLDTLLLATPITNTAPAPRCTDTPPASAQSLTNADFHHLAAAQAKRDRKRRRHRQA